MLYTALLLLIALPALAADVGGVWEFTATRFGEDTYWHLDLKAQGEKVSGTLDEVKVEGTIDGSAITLICREPDGEMLGTLHGTVHDNEMSGDGILREKEKVNWVARRAAPHPASAAVHDFAPTQFHRQFSAAIPPVMHINAGDTVRTWTVDAGGVDPHGERRSLGGNPETGPFYIEGAFPGDTLVVKLNKVRLNRDTAESGGEIASNAVTPGYVHDAKYDEKFNSEWKLDREKGIGTLAKPSGKMGNYNVTLRPMLGCLAVAPPGRQAFRTGDLGPFGGNMDYREMREGVTVYLPVFQPGALFFLGDGHAAQGDGELTGDALETSMDVEFSVDLIKNYATRGPRAENDEYLMSLGIGGSLGDAMQIATAQLAHWLERDYKLRANEVAIVLGTAMRYQIAEVVDPKYNVVAKIAKSALDGIDRE